MKKAIKITGAATLLAMCAVQTATASSMRCGTHVISSGQSNSPGQYEVLKRCGEPDARQGNTWIYKSGSVTRQVRFDRNGVILDIR